MGGSEMEGASLPVAADALVARYYDELRSIARRELGGEGSEHTLQPTALVHEAFLRLAGSGSEFESRAHFFGAAARAIRRVLVDHARRRASLRRGGAMQRAEQSDFPAAQDERWLALDAALESLAGLSPQQARIVELRFFADMTNAEIAAALGVSESTVARQWRVARAWLLQALGVDGGS